MKSISVSILNASNRSTCIKKLNKTDCEYIHIDVMDGKFVPNKQFSLSEIKKLGLISSKKLDIHLMTENPIKYLKTISLLNVSFVTFHIEINKNIDLIISEIKKYGFKVGLAINPTTPIEEIYPYLKKIDLILIMSVPAGYGGQVFDINTIKRIEQIKKEMNSNTIIEVDGGINKENVNLLNDASIIVAGSYIINDNDYQKQINSLRS